MTRRALLAAIAVVALAVIGTPAAGAAAPAKINGMGSTYVGLAMQQWVADGQVDGLSINYLPNGSPSGLGGFAAQTVDFAGTEAEYSALGGSEPARGFQYVPDVAGAVAIMYNVEDKAGKKVDYLRLSRLTVARIFMGDITRWSDPAISDDNKGLVLPDEQIRVVYRGGQSGTTALFYDFVAHTAMNVFSAWTARNRLPTAVRIIQLDSAPDFAPRTEAQASSEQIAQSIAKASGKWSIGYDEFGYAKVYGADVARIENASGSWVLPFAQNISAAMESATLRPDLSQELSGVYASTNPDAYPISAYSYLVTQCAPAGDRPTSKGPYDNPGVTETLARWMRYIACEGQVSMAEIGYSPLPPNLSQEMVNSVARMQGTAPDTLSAGNCANPRFQGSLGEGAVSPPDVLAGVESLGSGGTGGGGAGAGATGSGDGGGGGGANGGAGAAIPGPGGTSSGVAAGTAGAASAGVVGRASQQASSSGAAARRTNIAAAGGSASWREAEPVAYDRPVVTAAGIWLVLLLVTLIGAPLLFAVLRKL